MSHASDSKIGTIVDTLPGERQTDRQAQTERKRQRKTDETDRQTQRKRQRQTDRDRQEGNGQIRPN